MAVGLPLKTTYANGDVYSASDVNDTNGTVNLFTSTTLSQSAGKNAIINGGFDVWQRGTSFTSIGGIYIADRWYTFGTSGRTISRQTTSDTTNLPTIQYCARVQRNSGSTSTVLADIGSPVETANAYPYAGKAITLSYYARRGANFSGASNLLTTRLYTGTGSDQNAFTGYTGQATPIDTTVTLTTTWQRFQHTITLGATVTEFMPYFAYTPSGTAGAADYYEVTGVQIELGSVATTFSRAGGTIAGELAACQRYYFKLTNGVANAALMSAFYFSASSVNAYVPFPVTMRTSPAIDQVTGTNYYSFVRNGGTDTFNSFTLDQSNSTGVAIYNNSEASGTAGQAGYVFANNAAAYLAFTSEL
ncbi:hypothetical protein UFOVP709_21 [uncultured Caudovirales phage]|uniref:Uncharacterized protein n=1 Tax=uncultured Caudovirales phage TaxID=2100421 RepID=A0A6J5NG33_9CAUD|nr:hypothetical protein UFOVP709_21 [uncultured Caudovirales phage]